MAQNKSADQQSGMAALGYILTCMKQKSTIFAPYKMNNKISIFLITGMMMFLFSCNQKTGKTETTEVSYVESACDSTDFIETKHFLSNPDYEIKEKNISEENTDKNSLTNDSNNLLLSEFIVDNEVFEYILDTLTEEYNKCEIVEKGYHFTVFINDAKIKDYSGMKFLSVSRSFYKGFVSRYKGSVSMEYGFFYYKDYLFILEGQQLKDIFKKTDRTQKFSYKDEPVVIFDPPRWLYYYWNKDFYFGDSAPCGG